MAIQTNLFRPQSPLERRYQGEHPLSTLGYLFEAERGKLLLAMGLFVIKHSPTWILPLLTANIIDVIVQHRPLAELWLNALVLGVLLFQNVPMHFLYVRYLSLAVRAVEMRLRSALCRRLQHLSIGYFTRASAGVLQTKVLRDVEALEQMIRQTFDGGMAALSSMLGAIIITAVRAPVFLLFFLVMVPVSALLVYSLRRTLVERNQQFRAEIERMSARVAEMTHLIPITRAHGLEQDELDRVDESLSQVQQAGLQLDSGNALFGAVAWVTYNLFSAACLVVAAWAAYTGWAHLTAGDVVMVTGYFNTLTNAAMGLAGLAPIVTKGFESLRSIGEVLESPDVEHNAGKTAVAAVRGDIGFEAVSFKYPDTDVAAIHELTLQVLSGETVALVGPSGAGKSTVLNLVIGFLRPTSGRMVLDGSDMETLDLRTYRRFLSVVPQESILFEGTVRENVTYGLKGVRDAAVLAALQSANALEFVEEMAAGLDTRVGERGAKLSGGQKQRLAIARALIRNPRVLILDEATSALDTESEALIQEALERLMRGRTTFVVAHRLSTVRHANRIVVLEHGRIVETGAHADLLAAGGLYTRLQARQLA